MTGIAKKRKVTYYLTEDLLRAERVHAARTSQRDSDVVEAALRAYLGFDVVERVWSRSDLSEDEAMDLAVTAIHDMRDERRAASRS